MKFEKRIKTIYFIDGAVPTDKDLKAIENLSGKVVLRNSRFVPDDLSDGQIEVCDFVAGCVPKSYAEKRELIKELSTIAEPKSKKSNKKQTMWAPGK